VRDQGRDDQHADAAPEVPHPVGRNPGRPADGLYPRRVADSARIRGTAEPEPWGEDPGLTAHLGAQAGATLEVGELPEVRGDARQLRRLLQTLVSNAVKLRGVAAPYVTVSADPGADGWVVAVTDNGAGVAPEDAGRIFGMFARASRDHDGTGIGLAVCRRVVEAHGGLGRARRRRRQRVSLHAAALSAAALSRSASARCARPPTATGSDRCPRPRSRGRGR
jgi:histidine kinase/DNA gyrase B/HSP90-like ATPase